MSEKPSYLDLLNKRVSAGARRIVREKVSLDPELFEEYEAVKQELSAEIAATKRDDKPTKMNGGPLDALRARVDDLEQQIKDTTIVVTLKALNSEDLLQAQTTVTEDSPMVDVWRARLTVAFVEAKTVDREPIPEIDRAEWSRLLSITASGELQKWHNDLERAGGAPAFPTFAK